MLQTQVPKPPHRSAGEANRKKEVAPELQIVNGGIFGHCAAYSKEDYIDLDSKHEKEKRFKDEIKFDDDLCDNAETSYTGKFKLKYNHS